MHDGVEDSSLAQGLMRKEPWAARELYRRHGPAARRVLARLVGVTADLDDLLQTVFLDALRSVSHLRDVQRLPQWLTGVAVLTARKYLRTRRRWRWLGFTDTVPDVEGDSSSPELRAEVQATFDLLEHLEPDERIVFSLRYFEQLKLEEIAEATGASLATVKRRLARGETTFRKAAGRHPRLAHRVTVRFSP